MRARWFLLSLCLLLALGCGPASHPLDDNVAQTSLEKALQAWSSGKTPQDLQPEIIMGDSAWEKGSELVKYEILQETAKSDGTNLHIEVKRTLKTDGKESQSQVHYIVGTSPVVTIFPQ